MVPVNESSTYPGFHLSRVDCTTCDEVSVGIKKEFNSDPVYNETYLKTKIKSHGDEITDFYVKKNSKVRL